MKPRLVQPHWPEVLTDWCVIRALKAAGWPVELAQYSGAQAAFVSEVSAYVRFRALDLRELEVEARVSAAVERVYELAGGHPYRLAKSEFTAVQSGFLMALGRTHNSTESPDRLRAELSRCEAHLDDLRRPVTREARIAGRLTAERYWQTVAACRVPEGFFVRVPARSAIAQMRARFDLWWELSLRSLRRVLQETNPSYCRLLQALPAIRAESARPGQKFVLAALVHDWREAHAERFGLFKDIHFPVLEQRAFAKFDEVNAWFDHEAPGYKRDDAVRETAVRALYGGLADVTSDYRPVHWDN
ncbi:MAG: hypothetical protein JNL92_10575 [Opitutaceae bacterium]|nr:hypothetical protein [Opitutaceae bacterium]